MKLTTLLRFSLVGLASSAHAFDEYLTEEVIFVTPANMASSYTNSPNSVTRLDSEVLNALGIRTITDAMRLVPGMVVAETHGSNTAIGYHGTNVHVPRRTQVLFNSNRIYRAGYSDVLWERNPYDISDIGNLEVVRGSSVADWGSNAFSATVNMISEPVAVQPDANVLVEGGHGGYRKLLASTAFDLGQSKHRVRVLQKESEGFDTSYEITDFTDSYEGQSFFYNGEYEITSGQLLDWYVATSDYSYEFPTIDNIVSEDPDLQAVVGGFSPDGPTDEKTVNANLKYTSSRIDGDTKTNWHVGLNIADFERDQDMIYCYPAFFYDPILAQLDAAENIHLELSDLELLFGSSLMTGVARLNDSLRGPLTDDQTLLLTEFAQTVRTVGLGPMLADQCSSSDQDLRESRYSLLADFSRTNSDWGWSSTFFLSENVAKSQSYLQGTHRRWSAEWSNNLRYSVTERLTVNVGALAETDSDIDQVFLSPRIAANFAFRPNHIGRVLAGRSHRLPGIHETERDWQYTNVFDQGDTDYLGRTEGRSLRRSVAHDLEPEELTTVEAGYTYTAGSAGAWVDVKVFREKYQNLISESFSYLAFDLSNEGEATVTGAESELSYQMRTRVPVRLGGTLTYIDTETNKLEEKTLYSRLFGSVYAIVPIDQWTIGLAYYGNKDIAFDSYDRFDFNLLWEMEIGRSLLELGLNYRHYPSDQASLSEYSSIDPYHFGYADRDRFILKAQLKY